MSGLSITDERLLGYLLASGTILKQLSTLAVHFVHDSNDRSIDLS